MKHHITLYLNNVDGYTVNVVNTVTYQNEFTYTSHYPEDVAIIISLLHSNYKKDKLNQFYITHEGGARYHLYRDNVLIRSIDLESSKLMFITSYFEPSICITMSTSELKNKWLINLFNKATV